MIGRCLDLTASPRADKPMLAIGLHVIIDGLIQNWMSVPDAFDLVKVGRLTVVTYLRGINGCAMAMNSDEKATIR